MCRGAGSCRRRDAGGPRSGETGKEDDARKCTEHRRTPEHTGNGSVTVSDHSPVPQFLFQELKGRQVHGEGAAAVCGRAARDQEPRGPQGHFRPHQQEHVRGAGWQAGWAWSRSSHGMGGGVGHQQGPQRPPGPPGPPGSPRQPLVATAGGQTTEGRRRPLATWPPRGRPQRSRQSVCHRLESQRRFGVGPGSSGELIIQRFRVRYRRCRD